MANRSKEELLALLDTLYEQMINNRTQQDIDNILALGYYAYDDLNATQKTFITSPQKGAYNYQDRNRVGQFCNALVELMHVYFGTITDGYSDMPTNWETISDPTQTQLENYINMIIVVRNKWYTELRISGSRPSISQIYDGISLATANNIETVMKAIHDNLNDYMMTVDARYCGQLYGTSSADVIACGLDIWTGVSREI